MIMIVISFALVTFYAFAILYVLMVMQIKLVVVVQSKIITRLQAYMYSGYTREVNPIHKHV